MTTGQRTIDWSGCLTLAHMKSLFTPQFRGSAHWRTHAGSGIGMEPTEAGKKSKERVEERRSSILPGRKQLLEAKALESERQH